MRGDRLVLQLYVLIPSTLHSLSFWALEILFLSLWSFCQLSCSCRYYSCHLIPCRLSLSITPHPTTATYLPFPQSSLTFLYFNTHIHTLSKSQPGGSGSNGSSSKFTHTSDAAMVDHVAMSLSSLYVSVSFILTLCFLYVTLLSPESWYRLQSC